MASDVVHQLAPWSCRDGKIVMVTGDSSGLGREFCLDLAKAGCRVVAAARRTDRLISLCNKINMQMARDNGDGGCRAVAVKLDIASDGGAIEASVAKAWSAFGYIDTLINNAGMRGIKLSLLNKRNTS